MNIYSTSETEQEFSQLQTVTSRLLERQVTNITRIAGGKNSRVYRLNCGQSEQYAAKVYFRHNSDQRNRLANEFASLQFLWNNQIRNIPQPVAADQVYGCGIYEYIEGQRIRSSEITNTEIDTAVRFLIKLESLKYHQGSGHYQ